MEWRLYSIPDCPDVRLVIVDDNSDIDNYKASPSTYEKYIRYTYFAPWGKIMNFSALQNGAIHPHIPIHIVVKNNIRFDEIRADGRALYARPSFLTYSGFTTPQCLEHTGVSGRYKKFLKDRNINLNESAKRLTDLGCSNAINLSLKPIIGLVDFFVCDGSVSKCAVYRDAMRIVIVNTKVWLWKQTTIIQ